jgi:predicted regulator of Ras-like GTPase activity (Roadblock/LC7/MglB family)
VKEILEPLVRIPGVRTAVLHSADGVPIAVHDRRQSKEAGEARGWTDSSEDLDALTGLAAGWLGDVTRSVGRLSWNAPRRLVLHATRGTVVMVLAPGAVLLVLLDRGMRPEELRLPMEGAVARMQRVLRGMGRREDEATSTAALDALPGVVPSDPRPSASEAGGEVEVTGKGVPELSGE